ncbi:hypothetical protein PCE1_003224 [Barthelona sp. PCE]
MAMRFCCSFFLAIMVLCTAQSLVADIHTATRDFVHKTLAIDLPTSEFYDKFVKVSSASTGRPHEGFGVAITESTAYSYGLVVDKEAFLDTLFADARINLVRLHIGSCDFSLSRWSCAEQTDDFELSSFSLENDRKYILPLLRDIRNRYDHIRFIAAPWSPPKWMKNGDSYDYTTIPCLKEDARYHDAYARYLSKWISEYAKEGIPISFLSVQNEVNHGRNGKSTWPACVWNGGEMARFIRDHLGPIIKKDHDGSVGIGIYDHNKHDMTTFLNDFETECPIGSDCSDLYQFISFHYYHQRPGDFHRVKNVADSYGNKKILATEACNCPIVIDDVLGDYEWGERLIHDAMKAIGSGAQSYIVWNALLLGYDIYDPHPPINGSIFKAGGPNVAYNWCNAPGHVMPSGRVWYRHEYTLLRQLSKYIEPGMEILHPDSTEHSIVAKGTDKYVFVVQNLEYDEQEIALCIDDNCGLVNVPAFSVVTSVVALK